MAVQKKPFPGSKYVLSIGLIIVSAAYALWQQTAGQSSALSPAQQFKNANDAFLQTLSQLGASTTSSSPSAQPPSMMGGGSGMMRGLYTDGSYTGSLVDAFYGMLQVQAIIRGGRIANVQFLRYANDTETSRFINVQAMPLLSQEAVVAQSAQVDGVSGATFTSQAFRESLASALAQAKK